jgi:prolipoprotein diacylglyceryltransferase
MHMLVNEIYNVRYLLLSILGVGFCLMILPRLMRAESRTFVLWGILCGLLGGKLLHFILDAGKLWGNPANWKEFMTGNSVLGFVVGSYIGLRVLGRHRHYYKLTFDTFARLVPLAVILFRLMTAQANSRVGIICSNTWYAFQDPLGQTRWPAFQVEIFFNLVIYGLLCSFHRNNEFRGEHLRIYCVGCASFIFMHEFVMEVPRSVSGLSHNQMAALIILTALVLDLWRSHRKAVHMEQQTTAIGVM